MIYELDRLVAKTIQSVSLQAVRSFCSFFNYDSYLISDFFYGFRYLIHVLLQIGPAMEIFSEFFFVDDKKEQPNEIA